MGKTKGNWGDDEIKAWDPDLEEKVRLRDSDNGGEWRLQQGTGCFPSEGVAQINQPRSCPPTVEAIAPTHFLEQHNPAKVLSSFCHNSGSAHSPAYVRKTDQILPIPHTAEPFCWSQDSLNSWTLAEGVLILIHIQLSKSSTETVPHLWCCIILDLLWLNKYSCKPWSPHSGTKLRVTSLLSLHTAVPLGSTTVWRGKGVSGWVSLLSFY